MQTMVSTAGEPDSGATPTPPPDFLAPGAMAGPWRVERELGRGGMGAVYAVVHEEIGKRAALKVVHGRLLAASFNTERMVLEAKVVNQVAHPGIVDIFETGKLEDGRPYIVMERLDGQPLAHRADEGKLLPDLVIEILLQIGDALVAAHAAGVIHRDLKLDNVFLLENPDDPGTPRVKVLDWGIAKIVNHDVRHTIEGQLVGTPQYLSPEQARGALVTPQTDVYSLGVMAYELFLEQLPFEAETAAEIMVMHLRNTPPPPRDLWPDMPRDLEALVLAMLAKSPADRPTMVEVVQRLEAVRGDVGARRRASTNPLPRARTATPVIGHRAQSANGLAETEFGDLPRQPRRWKLALGAAAIAAASLVFALGRDGDTPAAAAATAVDAAPAAVVASPPPPPANDEVAIVEPETAPAPTSPAAAPATSVPAATGSAARKPTARPAATRTPTRAGSASPRRSSRVDPDGTLDAY